MIKGNVVEKLPSYGVLQAPQKENKWNVVVWRERLNKKSEEKIGKVIPKKVKTTKETISKETKRQDQKRKGKERTGRKGKITKVEGRKHCRVSPFSAQRADRDLARERERES